MGFVPLDEYLADLDGRLDVPDDLQKGVSAPDDGNRTDFGRIGSDAPIARPGNDS